MANVLMSTKQLCPSATALSETKTWKQEGDMGKKAMSSSGKGYKKNMITVQFAHD